MSATDAELSNLKRYKTLRRRFLYLAAAFVPVMVVLLRESELLVGSYLLAQMVGFATLAILAAMWVSTQLLAVSKMQELIGWWPPLSVSCRHCGFPRN